MPYPCDNDHWHGDEHLIDERIEQASTEPDPDLEREARIQEGTLYALYFRGKITINTDPLRRCYDGCNFSEREEWSAWKFICRYASKEDADESAATFKKINPTREYKIVPVAAPWN